MAYSPFIRIFYTAIFLLIMVSVSFSFLLKGNFQASTGYFFLYIRGYWIFLALFFLSISLLADLLRILNHFFDIFPASVVNNYPKVKLFFFFGVLFLSVIISIVGSSEFSNSKISELNLTIDKNKGCCEDLNIVAASDLHIGSLIHKGRLASWIALINRQHPDIILLVGDIFDRSFNSRDSLDIIGELCKLKSKYGVFAVPGNHEYYFNINRSIKYLEDAGITVLRDQNVTVDNKLVIIGRDDAYNSIKRKTIKSLMAGVDTLLPLIMMDHQPYDTEEAIKNKIDLYISGHTHNGQIFPGNILAKSEWELVYGYRKKGNTHLYVSSGLGVLYVPIRLGTQSEIVRINLKE